MKNLQKNDPVDFMKNTSIFSSNSVFSITNEKVSENLAFVPASFTLKHNRNNIEVVQLKNDTCANTPLCMKVL